MLASRVLDPGRRGRGGCARLRGLVVGLSFVYGFFGRREPFGAPEILFLRGLKQRDVSFQELRGWRFRPGFFGGGA